MQKIVRRFIMIKKNVKFVNFKDANKCIELACCDCGYIMCKSCRNSDINCGCYGKCVSCNTDVNRGEDGSISAKNGIVVNADLTQNVMMLMMKIIKLKIYLTLIYKNIYIEYVYGDISN